MPGGLNRRFCQRSRAVELAPGGIHGRWSPPPRPTRSAPLPHHRQRQQDRCDHDMSRLALRSPPSGCWNGVYTGRVSVCALLSPVWSDGRVQMMHTKRSTRSLAQAALSCAAAAAAAAAVIRSPPALLLLCFAAVRAMATAANGTHGIGRLAPNETALLVCDVQV